MGWKSDINKASQGGLTDKEIKKINEKYENKSGQDIRSYATNQGYLGGTTSAPAPSTNTGYQAGGAQNATSPTPGTDAWQAPGQNLYDWQAGLLNIQASATTNSTSIRAEADKEIARIDADARKYGYDLGLEGTKYTADKEAEWRRAVADIEVKGKLDLQPIINAGLQRVAEIEGQSARDVADITGGYNLRSMQERTAADKALGQMQLAGGMYGLIGAAFG